MSGNGNNGNGRVTNVQLDEKLNALRRDVKVWIAVALLGGQTLASLITAAITRMTPPQQAAAIAHLVATHLL